MQKVILGLFLIIAACNTGEREISSEPKSSDGDTVSIAGKPAADSLIVQGWEDSKTADLYEYRNDTLLQSVEVNYISKQEISFKVVSFNKAKNKTSSLTGTAKGNLNQDPEMDEDDQGTAYAAIHYGYRKDNCYLSIRIALDSKDKAKIFESNCGKLHDSSCPFASLGVLRKIER